MKKIFSILLVCSLGFSVQGQIYIPIKTWTEFVRTRNTQVLTVPLDTIYTKAAGSICWINGTLYVANGSFWSQILGSTAGSGKIYPVVSGVDTGVVTPAMKNQWDSYVGGSGAINRIPRFNSTKTLTNSGFSDDGTTILSDRVMKYSADFSSSFSDPRAIPDAGWINNQIAGISTGGTSELQNISIASMDATSGLSTTKTYFITDTLRSGLYRFKGFVPDQSSDNQGRVIVAPDNKAFERINFSNHIRAIWYFKGTYIPVSVANSSVDTAVGSDAAPCINLAVKDHKVGEVVDIDMPMVLHTMIDTINKTQTFINIDGQLHTNKRHAFLIYPPTSAGADLSHVFTGKGTLIGRENTASHTKTSHDNGTGPVWSGMTNNAFEIGNCNKNTIQIHKISAFGSFVQFRNGAGSGSQENTVAWQWIDRCARGISMVSLTGHSFCDKNLFTGFDGGQARIDAGLGFQLDGNADSSYTGEAGFNTFQNVTFERVDSAIDIKGRWIEGGFEHCKIEQGLGTGVFGDNTKAITVRNTGGGIFSLSSARGFYMNGCSFIYADMMSGGIGPAATISNTPLWVRDLPAGNNGTWIGSTAYTDEVGLNIIITDAPANFSLTNRNRVPSVYKFRETVRYRDEDTTITAATYTLPNYIRNLRVNSATSKITLPPAATFLKKKYTISNYGTGPDTLVNLTYGSVVIPVGSAANIYGDGSVWTRTDGLSTAGGGTSPLIAGSGTGSPYYHPNPLNIGVNPAQSYAWTHWGASSNSRSLWEMSSASAYQSTPRNNTVDYDPVLGFRWTNNTGSSGKFITEISSGSLSGNLSWQANKIGLNKIATASADAGDPVVSDGLGAATTTRPPYTLAFSQYTNVSVSNATAGTTKSSILSGNAYSFSSEQGNLGAGDVIELSGSGDIAIPASPQTTATLTLDFGAYSLPLATVGPADGGYLYTTVKPYSYRFRIIPNSYGTNVGGVIYIQLYVAGQNETNAGGHAGGSVWDYTTTISSGINAVAPTCNLSVTWASSITTFPHSWNSRINIIEIKRVPHFL